MRSHAAGERCLMQVLTDALDDPHAGPCGRCSVCTGVIPPPGRQPSRQSQVEAAAFLRGREHVIEPRKRWPTGARRKGRITGYTTARAIAFADDPAWSELVAELAEADAPPSEILFSAIKDVARAMGSEVGQFTAVIPVPSRARSLRIDGIAKAAAEVLGVGVLPLLEIRGPAPDHDVASLTLVQQLETGLRVKPGAQVPTGRVLIVDDSARTTWTLTLAAALLVEAGVSQVHGLIGHQKAG